MKIFLSFLQSKIQHPIAAYSFWEYYIKNGIEETEHTWLEVDEVDWAAGLVQKTEEEHEKWKTLTWEKTVSAIKKNHPDIFLSYLYPQQIDIQAIYEIRRMGVYCVNFFCDHLRFFKKLPAEFKVFDLNWVPEYKAIQLYQKAKQHYLHLPMPMWVDPKYRNMPDHENERISFIGSKDIQRHLFFEKLINISPSIDLDIYGSGWNDEARMPNFKRQSVVEKIKNQFQFLRRNGLNPYLNKLKQSKLHPQTSKELQQLIQGKPDFENYVKITRESKVTLGINRYPSFNFPLHQPDTYSRLRDIEAPMLGACYLTEWTEGLDKLYDLKDDISTYRTAEELIEQINELSKSSSRRALLRKNAQHQALSQHSIAATIKKITSQF
ncbi:glycosyltransferase family protein [Pedobacter sp. 22226]|uniref:glycosyltransferase family protein n=1 Tax=Pedobacter sp. 22226 TaxID=3453894 RepID=UPI003F829B52